MLEISREKFLKLSNVEKARILRYIAAGVIKYKK